jgi:hypothetical protein
MQREILPKRALKKEAMMNRMLLVIGILLVPALAFAQEGGELPGGLLGQMLGWLLSAAGLTLIGQLLRGLPIVLPGWVKPFLAPAFGMLAGLINTWWGILPDFGPILGALLGTTSAFLFDAGKELGLLKSSSGK